jgi:putative membrane protein
MKTTMLSAALVSGLLFATSCSSNTDSKDVAENVNDKKIEKMDSANTNGGAMATAGSEGNAKDVADYMVTLANTSRAEYEMSQVAASRATSPAVKAYASKTVSQHAKDEEELKSEAAKYNITLPTALSNDSQDMLSGLNKETKTMDFEKKYLDDMTDVNDKAISKEKDLVDKTTNTDLKAYAQKMMADDQKHLTEATTLRNTLK